MRYFIVLIKPVINLQVTDYGVVLYSIEIYSVTRNYFENLVRALENGLSDVDSHGDCSRTTTGSKSLGGGTTNKVKGGRGKATSSRSSGSGRNNDDSNHWSCQHCTFGNVNTAAFCQICRQRR